MHYWGPSVKGPIGARRQSLKCTNYCLDSCRQCRTGKLISLSGQNSLRCEAVFKPHPDLEETLFMMFHNFNYVNTLSKY